MQLSILAEKAQLLPAVSVQVTFTKTDPNPISSWARHDVPVQEVQTFLSMMLVPLCALFILCAHLHGPASSGAASCASKALQLWRVGSGCLSMEIIRVGVNLMWVWTKLDLPGWTECYLLEFQNFDFWFDSCFRHNFRSLIWRENIFPTWLEAMSRAMQYDPHWEYFSSAEIVDDAQTCAHALIVNSICTCYCFL